RERERDLARAPEPTAHPAHETGTCAEPGRLAARKDSVADRVEQELRAAAQYTALAARHAEPGVVVGLHERVVDERARPRHRLVVDAGAGAEPPPVRVERIVRTGRARAAMIDRSRKEIDR